MKELISVIIPAYNAEQFLGACLSSMTEQTYENLEVIVVNDGSSDKTGEIAAQWGQKDFRIKVVHQDNQGVSAARNAGLEIAKGDYIGFVDADDEVKNDFYEFLYQNLKKYEADISHCGFELVKNERIVQFHNTGIILVQNKVEALQELLSGARIEPSTCNKLFKKEVIKNLFFATDIKFNEDLLFNIEAFKNAEKTVFEDVVKYKYNFNPSSASRSSKTLFIEEEIYNAAKRVRFLLQDNETKAAVEKFYVAKLLTSLKSLKKDKLFQTGVAKKMRSELKQNTTRNLGLRLSVLKVLLVNFPFLYDPIIYFYDLLFAKNQKWNNE